MKTQEEKIAEDDFKENVSGHEIQEEESVKEENKNGKEEKQPNLNVIL